MDTMATVRELLEKGRFVENLDYSLKISKLTQEVQWRIVLFESKDLELHTKPGSMEAPSRLPEKSCEPKRGKDRSHAENKIVPALETKIVELKTMTGSVICFLQEVKARAFKNKRNLKKEQEAVAVLDFQETTLTDNVASPTEELS